MSIFSRIAEIIGEDYMLNLTIQKKGNKLSVVVLPKGLLKNPGPEFKAMQPIVLTGTPAELDAGFLAAIVLPVAGLNKLTVSGGSFVKEKKATTKKADEKPAEPSLDLRSDASSDAAIEASTEKGTGQAPVTEAAAPVTEAAPVAETEEAPTAAAPAAETPTAAPADTEPTLGEIDNMSNEEGW